jgi:hypothetical protein
MTRLQELLNFWEWIFSDKNPGVGIMVDDDRVEPVTEIILHQAAGPTCYNWSADRIQNIFDDVGKNRGYESYRKVMIKSGQLAKYRNVRSYHLHPQFNRETYAQAHFALYPYDKDPSAHGVKFGWRLVPLIHGVMQNVTWHICRRDQAAWCWKIQQQSIGIEICGNYSNKLIDLRALDCIAWFFVEYARELKKQDRRLKVSGHKDYGSTGCPGKIYGQLPYLREKLGVV